MNTSTQAKLKIHAVEVHDADGNHVRTHLMPGGKYWKVNIARGVHPVHGESDRQGIIYHEVK